jgi:hypothetical protein
MSSPLAERMKVDARKAGKGDFMRKTVTIVG